MIEDNHDQEHNQNLHENLNPPPITSNINENHHQQQQNNNANFEGDIFIVPVILHSGYYPYRTPAVVPITPVEKLLYQPAYVLCQHCNKDGITVTNSQFECHWCILACITGLIPWCIYSLIKKGDCSCMKATHKCRHCDVVLKELKNC